MKSAHVNISCFKNRHKGETIIVCGCGASLNSLGDPHQIITIGVNDVGRLFDPTYLVVLNPKHQFKGDRYSYVENSKARAIFSQLELPFKHQTKIKFKLGSRSGTQISADNAVPYTKNSPYVAVCLAEYMGATTIGLIGVDFTEHHFFAKTGRHALASELERIDAEYGRLATELKRRGVQLVNLSCASRLKSLPKVSPQQLFHRQDKTWSRSGMQSDSDFYKDEQVKTTVLQGFNVVHMSKTNCAGAIWNLNKALNKYTRVNSRVITGSAITSGLVYPKDVLLSQKSQVRQLLEQADLIHFHNNLDKNSPELCAYKDLLCTKPAVIQYHSEPEILKTYFNRRIFDHNAEMKTLVVAQKHIRFYPNSRPVPNIVDIYDSKLMPVKRAVNNVLTVMYSPTDKNDYQDYKNTCCGKGYKDTVDILNQLKREGIIDFMIVDKTPWSRLMQLRADVDVLIDECVTGGYHITSLEGLSQGLATVAYLDKEMIAHLCALTGSSERELPWLNTSINGLKEQLKALARDPAQLQNIQLSSRGWMENYWNPEKALAHYLTIYKQQALRAAAISCTKYHNAGRIIGGSRDIKFQTRAVEYVIAGKPGKRSECYPQTVRLHERLLALKEDKHGDDCHILGNGPSIGEVDLSKLYDDTVIGVNAAPLLHERLGRKADYYCITDRRFFSRDNICEILRLSKPSTRVFAGYCADFIKDNDVNYVKICGGDGISDDIYKGFYHGCSVVLFAAQLAMWLGYRNIYLYGCEFNYNNGRFYKEQTPMPFDSHTYPRIEHNFKLLKAALSRRGGELNVVGPSRLVGDFGSQAVRGVKRLVQFDCIT